MSSTPRNTSLLLAGKLLLGLGLLFLIAVVAGGMWPEEQGHGIMQAAQVESSETTAGNAAAAVQSTAAPLTAFQQAAQAGNHLGLSAAADPLNTYAEPAPGAAIVRTLPRNGELDVLTTFYALAEATDELGRTWYQVQLPVRPNGTTAWVKAGDVDLFELPYRLEIRQAEFRLDVFEHGELLKSFPIGLGTADTPTPLGDYYVVTKMRPPDPNGVYGALAMGVSAFSEQLTDWPGGGQVGIHGTNDPDGSIGRRVSHGCIRLRNEDIMELTNYAPLGTPVLIAN